jgi:hypothetical protein
MDTSVSIVTTRQTVILIATTSHCATVKEPICSTRCFLLSLRKAVLKEWLTELTQNKESARVQHGAMIRLPGRAVRNAELRR